MDVVEEKRVVDGGNACGRVRARSRVIWRRQVIDSPSGDNA